MKIGSLACALIVFSQLANPLRAWAAAAATPPAHASVDCVVPDQLTPSQAFARAIADARTLAFIELVESKPASTYAAIGKRASAGLPHTVISELDRKMSDACGAEDIAYRTARLAYDLSLRWTHYDGPVLQQSGRYALAALYFGDAVDLKTRDTALAPFALDTESLDAFAASALVAPTDCTANVPAKAPSPTQPSYPSAALSVPTRGRVQVSVALDEHGFVESVTLFKRDVPDTPGGDAIVDETILAAGSTGYTPEFVNCRPVSGRYDFRADFSFR